MLLFGLGLSSMTERVSAATYYADVSLGGACSRYSVIRRDCSGNDGNAYPSIQEAVAAMTPGDTLLIRSGVYKEMVSIHFDGTPESYLTIRNFPQEDPAVDGGGLLPPGEAGLIDIRKSAYVRLRGLRVRNSLRYGLLALDSRFVTIEHMEVSHSQHGGIVIRGGVGVRVLGCLVHHNNAIGLPAAHEALTLESVDGFEVGNCQVYENQEEGIDVKYGASRGSIHNNKVFRNNGPNIYIDAAHGVRVFNNEVFETKNQKPGIMIGIEQNRDRESVYDIEVVRNLLYRNERGILLWIEPGAESYASFRNVILEDNIVYQRGRQAGAAFSVSGGSPLNYGEELIVRGNVLSHPLEAQVTGVSNLLERFKLVDNLRLRGGLKPN